MAINLSGGMANARRKQKQMKARRLSAKNEDRKADRLKQKAQLKDKKEASTLAPPGDAFDENVIISSSVEYHQTKLGRLLEIIDTPIIILIILNALQMGLGTFDFVTQNPKVEEAFEIVDQVFLIIFTVEVSLNFIHYIRLDRVQVSSVGKFSFEEHSLREDAERLENRAWLYFDASVVIFSWAFASLSIIRAFRILRILRLISKVESLKNVVNALRKVMPRLGLVAFLLSLMFLVFGIGFTVLFADMYKNKHTSFDYFSSIDRTFLTLFQIMTFDNWHEIAREVMAVYPWSWILFVLWAMITGFVVINLIVAIICESLVTITEEKKLQNELEQQAVAKFKAEGRELSKADMKEFVLETQRSLSLNRSQRSLKSTKSENSMVSANYVFQLEDMVDDILEDQEALIETVEKLRDVMVDMIREHQPSESRLLEIRTIFGVRREHPTNLGISGRF
jgi:hypothetical protein